MKYLCAREEGKDGKVYWHRVGVLIDGKNGKQYVKLHMFPNMLLSVFKPKPKNEEETIDI